MLKTFNGNYIVPSHSNVTQNITDLVNINLDQIYQIIDLILKKLEYKKTLEQLVKEIFDYYNLKISNNKYLLVTSTIRSYLAYLYYLGKIDTEFENNYFYYRKKD